MGKIEKVSQSIRRPTRAQQQILSSHESRFINICDKLGSARIGTCPIPTSSLLSSGLSHPDISAGTGYWLPELPEFIAPRLWHPPMPARFTSFPHLALGETGKQHVHVHFISFHHVLHHTSTASTFSQIHVPWAARKNSGIFQCTLSGLPYPHLRVPGTDLWARCPDACIRRCIQCTNRTRSVTLKGTLSPTSTLAHRLVVIY